MKEVIESTTVECKPSLSQINEIIETISAFSNTEGGKVFVGVSKTGKIIGMQIGKGTIEKLTNSISQNTDPKVQPRITTPKLEGNTVIIIEVKKSLDKLTLAFGRPFKRVGKSTVKMSKDEYEWLILEKHKEYLRFDNQFCKEAQLNDINKNKVIEFLQKAKSERGLDINWKLPLKEILVRLKIMASNKLTNSAILLFGNNPQSIFIQAEIKCVRFKGIGVSGPMIDMKDIGGNIIGQVFQAEKFIFNHISLSSWIENEKIERKERWEYPVKAIREILVNAAAHRDYQSSSKIQIRIFDDRIEFWNPGKLPEGWTVETLKRKHESKPYNPLIARMFFWIKYIEEVGTGTNKIIDWCKEWGLPEPDIEYTGTNVIVILRKSKLTEEYLKDLDINEKEKKIIDFLRTNRKITSNDIQKMFNVSRDSANRYLKKLIGLLIIERKGVGKSIYYQFKTK